MRNVTHALSLLATAALLFALAPTASANTTPTTSALAHIDVDLISITNDPQKADFLRVRFSIENNGASGMSQSGVAFVTFSLPDGRTTSRRVRNVTVGVGESVQIRYKEFVPANVPDGTYTVTASFESNDRTTVYGSESTTFTLGDEDLTSAPVATTASLEVSAPEAGPNPFRESTTIRYSLADDADVSLTVYDVTGREVAALVSGTQTAGAHAAVFSADGLPAGTYVWRLSVGGEVTTGRVTLAR